MINGARKRDIEITITIEDAWNKFLEQEGKCALTGIDINLNRDCSRNWDDHTASLDRIDNTKGYIKDNVQWLHKVVNKLKNTLTEEEFIKWCTLVADHNRNKNALRQYFRLCETN